MLSFIDLLFWELFSKQKDIEMYNLTRPEQLNTKSFIIQKWLFEANFSDLHFN